MNISNIGGVVTINGKTYKGKSVSVINDKVYIDGKEVSGLEQAKTISIHIAGNCGEVHSETGDIKIDGNVDGSVSNTSGNVTCKDVQGNVSNISGDIRCSKVIGNVSSISGDINKSLW